MKIVCTFSTFRRISVNVVRKKTTFALVFEFEQQDVETMIKDYAGKRVGKIGKTKRMPLIKLTILLYSI
jgi:hypothetical protein